MLSESKQQIGDGIGNLLANHDVRLVRAVIQVQVHSVRSVSIVTRWLTSFFTSRDDGQTFLPNSVCLCNIHGSAKRDDDANDWFYDNVTEVLSFMNSEGCSIHECLRI
jgi:hypothetical protein